MPKEEFLEIVKEIKEKGKEFKITPRELLQYFSCEKRTKGNNAKLNAFLDENQLETDPEYTNAWIDATIILKHKKKAKTKKETDPIQRIKLLDAANRPPISIKKESQLKEAITLMMMHDYSQLPVMNGPRNVDGVISWETIGIALANGQKPEKVLDCMKKDVHVLDYETPLLEAISVIIDKGFVLVQKNDRTISGIVTIADISSQFLKLTEPFLLLEQIENILRQILNGKFIVEEIRQFCIESGAERDIEYIDDLTFGEYIRIIEHPDNWEKLQLEIDRTHFVKHLHKVREIRNDIMHFDPEGITAGQKKTLINIAKFLMELRKFL